MDATTDGATATLPSRITPELIARLTDYVATGNGTVDLVEVYTGAVYGTLPQSGTDQVAAAVATARTAQKKWAATPLSERLAVFQRFHDLILENHEIISDLIQIGTGKTRRMAFEESCDTPMVISHYLKTAKRVLAPIKRAGGIPFVNASIEMHKPKGVVAVISPWNFPFAISLSDSAPAFIAGNGVVLKPDNKTALCVLFAVDLLIKAGLPRDLVQVVCGTGPDIGPTLIDNVDYVMFTGSSATGRIIGSQAGANVISCSLELGGKNPMLILDDADLDVTVPGAVFAVYGNSGQACMHIERIYVHESKYDEFLRRFTEAAEELGKKAGAAYDFEPEFGSLVSVDHMERVSAHIEDAKAKGATVVTGGYPRPDLGPAFYQPTVLTGVTPDMVHAKAETFGPVVSIYKFRDVEEAIRLANDTDYGLNASVWGKNIARATEIGARLEAGNVNINDGFITSYSSKATPSGGVKQSGIGTRHGDAGLLKYTDTVHIGVQKIQVMAARAKQPYAQQLKSTLMTLKFMRRFGIR
ncbi:succinic semialdehyde dehydrogenase [Nocardia stercoris]|uniref:Succinate-semialdehyde dehydrogenase (NADP(+)) n=1 Tax=Nocardia stercoris TaxID=2483361 RepID=A0A3M2KXK6_9NOCA|nr:succinic semialdehyde dehydrogenase [Nocardia stercoris]RMI29376.1 succinate-semialdehyde dehydrogenase (NADP(+)) [Nocardia stercoris]